MKKRSAKKKSVAEPAPPAPLSAGRKWLFRITALLLPVFALGLLEIILRLAGAGYDPAFFKEVKEADGRSSLIENPTFSRRFFPPQLARWPESFKIPARKAPGARRIFILGESAAMGDPQPAYGPGRCLEILLRERFPAEKFEVVNLGITAINSHVIREIARELAGREGDVWLVYMGNNEMVGPFGAATVFGFRAPPAALVRGYLAAQTTRVGQLAVALARKIGGQGANPSWGGMKMFMQNQVAPGDARRETVYRNFERNLREIVQAGLDSGAKVVLSTMSVNLRDCPPFGSMLNSNLPAASREEFGRLFADALTAEQRGETARAVELFASATQLDPQFAEAQYRWGQNLHRLTNAAAREHLQLACDHDALPFRADTRINGAIKTLARELAGARLWLCDGEAELARAGAGGVAGAESFFEHVHFNFDGNYRLGLVWAGSVASALGLATNSITGWISQAVCEERLGLTDWNRLFVLQSVVRRLNGPPLNGQFNNAERLRIAEAEVARLERLNTEPAARQRTQERLNSAIRRAPEDVELYEASANVLEAVGDGRQAILAYQEAVKRRPHSFYANLQLGRLLGEQQRAADGQPHLEAATRLRPSVPDGWHELSVVLAAQGKLPAAREASERTLALSPKDAGFLAHHARLLVRLQRRPEAIEFYRRAIELKPESWEAHFELGNELAWDGQITAAAEEFVTALRLNPRHAPSHVNLGTLYARQNRLADAIARFEEALRIDPNYKEARGYLAQVQARAQAEAGVRGGPTGPARSR